MLEVEIHPDPAIDENGANFFRKSYCLEDFRRSSSGNPKAGR